MTKAHTSDCDLANINPFRYRGYVYDSETGLYYLKSRYYDPVTGRFLNADMYCDTQSNIFGTNMFAYCNNSPVVLTDATGSLSERGYNSVMRLDYLIHQLRIKRTLKVKVILLWI